MEERSTYEEEEFLTLYRKTKRTQRKKQCKDNNEDRGNIPSRQLSPFLTGTSKYEKVRNSGREFMSRPDFVQQFVKETLKDFNKGSVKGPEVSLEGAGKRVFLGECDFEEHEEEEEILHRRRKRVWRFQKTGKQGYDKFRRIVEFVMLAKRIFHRDSCAGLDELDSALYFYTQSTTASQQSDQQPGFDVAEFRGLKQKNFITTVKNSLQVPPGERTKAQINQMMHHLQSFRMFSNYPQKVQRGICKEGWYSRFERHKVLVREGSRAEFYYIILSGLAVVYRQNSSNVTSNTYEVYSPDILRQGDSIGEMEILTNSGRPGTIISKEPVEVLGIDKEVLLDIFKASDGHMCVNFLRTVPELCDFPLQLLQMYHLSCSTHYYRRGTVVVKNSIESEWVYVVKKGSCQVYSAIKNESQPDEFVTEPCANSEMRHGDFSLPNIAKSNKSSVLKSMSTENILGGTDKKRYSRKSPALCRSQTTFPVLNSGKTCLVTFDINQDNSGAQTPRKCCKKKSLENCLRSDSLVSLREKQTNSPRTPESVRSRLRSRHGSPESVISLDGGGSLSYVRLGIVTEKECFGLQSLLYDDIPKLSLVSSGAECVLISKQFLRDQMDQEIQTRLRLKVPPYPSIAQMRDALDDRYIWDKYRNRILHDIVK